MNPRGPGHANIMGILGRSGFHAAAFVSRRCWPHVSKLTSPKPSIHPSRVLQIAILVSLPVFLLARLKPGAFLSPQPPPLLAFPSMLYCLTVFLDVAPNQSWNRANHLCHLTPTNGLVDSNPLAMPGVCLLKNPYSLPACSQVLTQIFTTSRPHHFLASHEVSHSHPLHSCWLPVFQSRKCPSVLAFKAH